MIHAAANDTTIKISGRTHGRRRRPAVRGPAAPSPAGRLSITGWGTVVASEDLRLLGREFLLGEQALGLEFAELLELGHPVVPAGGRRDCSGCGGGRRGLRLGERRLGGRPAPRPARRPRPRPLLRLPAAPASGRPPRPRRRRRRHRRACCWLAAAACWLAAAAACCSAAFAAECLRMLPETAVALPAMTAVRAIVPINPGRPIRRGILPTPPRSRPRRPPARLHAGFAAGRRPRRPIRGWLRAARASQRFSPDHDQGRGARL